MVPIWYRNEGPTSEEPEVIQFPRTTFDLTPQKLMKTEDIARLLGIAPRTVCEWAEVGRLPAFKIGRQWRFRHIQIEHWLKHRATDLAV